MAEVVTVTVAEVIVETDDARSIVFAVPAEHAAAFEYRPGQFLTLRIPSDRTGSVARCYSLSSAPHEGRVQVTVKRAGFGSAWVCDELRAGAKIDVLPPAGDFGPSTPEGDFLLVAAGSGITPVMSILKAALEAGHGHTTLLYANRDEASVIFAKELANLGRRHPGRFTVLHWLENLQGLPTAKALETLAAPYRDREAYVCGPAPFMAEVKAALGALGVPKVHVEKFHSLTGNPFEDRRGPDEEDAGEPVRLTVDLDGEVRTVAWPRRRKLLDHLLAEGFDAPYSCREGQCSACACRLTSGEVKMLSNEVLDAEDVADGIVLACQSLPVTDRVSVSYE
ncbi:MAG TPA: ferredoxin--NADP reductase [Amycolatopsis sp.]|nr:ferredoxin--NADP reductase [Amycolatopsis sp.]